ncbi:replicative DNA helicase [Paenibacillus sp. JX-17]|uniref:Replicative DNA helicase n=1 Tax=Paenibacillus lacisoli TaxID=3064525 RepID=A0ABT9CKM5_9BACL|nr:replicative DNA helicase [Paenibacillus sp. JX-17]MDO7908457.1 replicative DNA helicase [Paenibacillus sp. JX-17]
MQDFAGLNNSIEMPASLEAERAVLGSIFIDSTAMTQAADGLQAGAFAESANRLIFSAALELVEADEPVDVVTISTRLQEKGQLQDIGGFNYLTKLARSVPTTTDIDYYIDILRDKHMLRQVIQASMLHIQEAAASGDISSLLSDMQNTASKLSDQAAPPQEFKPIREVALQVFENMENRYENRGETTGLASGYVDLDKMTAGFQRSDLIIVAARPSVGKTAFALNIAQNVAVRERETVAVFSLEMSAAQLVQRMVSAEANLDASKMRTGNFQEEDWSKASGAIGVLGESNIFIDDTPAITVNEIRNKCRRLKKQSGLGMVVIDYLQLIAGSGKHGANRQQEVSEISRTLKHMARELDVPVIALSQLSRGVEQRQDKRPMMSDLRESGAIEQDADIVAFLYRDDYYNQDTEKKNIIEIIIAKQRNGPVGTVELVFLKQFNKFVNYERAYAR